MIENNLPLLTVVVPCYNHQNYVVDCLLSVCAIDIHNKRVIVIDDGSTDKTVDLVSSFINNSEINIELIVKENSGLVNSLNIGLSMTNTEFIYLVASDDIVNPSGIQRSIEYLIKNSGCKFVIGGGYNFFDDGRKNTPIYEKRHSLFFKSSFRKRENDLFFDYPSPILLQSTVFRTSILKLVGGWNPEILLDDYHMFAKLFKIFPIEGVDFAFVPSFECVLYRHHGNNVHGNITRMFFMVSQTIMDLAPLKVRTKAISNALAFYTLMCLKKGLFNHLRNIYKMAPNNAYAYVVLYMFKILLNKLLARLYVRC